MTNLFLNCMSSTLIRTVTAKKSGKKMFSVSFPCDKSATGFASFVIYSDKMLYKATDSKGNPIVDKNGNQFVNILLGGESDARSVSIVTLDKAGNKAYETISMTNADILGCVEANRAAYKQAHAPAMA